MAREEKRSSEVTVRAENMLQRDAPAEQYPTLVVCAVIVRDGKVLLEKRAPKGVEGLDDMWDLPGGKVECGETPAQAIVREIQEELGVTVSARAMNLSGLEASSWKYADGRVRHWILLPYRCEVLAGEPQCGERLAWHEIATLDRNIVLTADYKIVTEAAVVALPGAVCAKCGEAAKVEAESVPSAPTPPQLANLLCNVAQILDVVKQEWGASWTKWDQATRDEISKELKRLYECAPPAVTP